MINVFSSKHSFFIQFLFYIKFLKFEFSLQIRQLVSSYTAESW